MPERIILTAENIEETAAHAADVLRQGGIILYPTDTLYGLGADSLSEAALQKIYTIKGRDEGKPIHSIFSSPEAARPYADITPLVQTLAASFLPGPLTLLLARSSAVPEFATAGKATFGIRVPDSAFCLALARAFGRPYTATSANKSGMAAEMNVDSILGQLGDTAALIDLIVDADELAASAPSTVVDARGDTPEIIREGAIPADKILKTAKS